MDTVIGVPVLRTFMWYVWTAWAVLTSMSMIATVRGTMTEVACLPTTAKMDDTGSSISAVKGTGKSSPPRTTRIPVNAMLTVVAVAIVSAGMTTWSFHSWVHVRVPLVNVSMLMQRYGALPVVAVMLAVLRRVSVHAPRVCLASWPLQDTAPFCSTLAYMMSSTSLRSTEDVVKRVTSTAPEMLGLIASIAIAIPYAMVCGPLFGAISMAVLLKTAPETVSKMHALKLMGVAPAPWVMSAGVGFAKLK
jgi:hypothetical protein